MKEIKALFIVPLMLFVQSWVSGQSVSRVNHVEAVQVKYPGLMVYGLDSLSVCVYDGARWTALRDAFPYRTTDNLAEGSRQYFTTARARNALSAGSGISYNSTTGVITATGGGGTDTTGLGLATRKNLSDTSAALRTLAATKQASITTGTTLQYLRGDLTLATFPTTVSTFTNDAAYVTTETDPTVSSTIKAITGTNISNWNTAYGWGNHASAGYLTAVPAQTFASLIGTPTTLAGYGITDAATSSHTHAFTSLTSIPTTLAGYGITDAANITHTHAQSDITGLVTALSGKQASITTGATSQYFKGDLSLGTFPTAVSTFTNDASYLTNTTGDARYALISHAHAQSDVTGLVSALSGKQSTITTGTTAQYFKGDLSLGTFPTNNTSFTNGAGYITGIAWGAITGPLSSQSDLSTALSGKESTITAPSTTGKYWTGYKTYGVLRTDSVAEVTNLYYTDARARAAISNGTNISYNSTTGVITNGISNNNQLTNGSGYLTANQSISFTPTGDVSSTGGSSATALTPAITVTGIKGSAVPALSTGLLKYNGSAWTYDATAYGTGSVTTASVVSANGFAGTVATASTTPAITLTTSISGMLRGNGTAISAATAGTDYVSPSSTEALSNKTISLTSNTLTGTIAQLNTAISDADVATLAGTEALTNKTIVMQAGTTVIVPETFTAGTNLTNAVAGGIEFDGTAFYKTVNTTNGRAQSMDYNLFRLAANGGALGPTIADYFGATGAAIPTVLNGVYKITFYLYYLKTTAGTVTYTITNTQAYTNLVANYTQSAVGGIATNASTTAAGVVTTTTAAAALPATASLTTLVNHYAVITAIAECGTAGNIRLRVTSSAGTITPLRGSYYTVERLSSGNVGTFVN